MTHSSGQAIGNLTTILRSFKKENPVDITLIRKAEKDLKRYLEDSKKDIY